MPSKGAIKAMLRSFTAALILLIFQALAACTASGGGTADGENWPLAGRDWRGQRFVANDDIGPGNVGSLGLAFEFRDFTVRGRTHRGLEATPLMVDGTLYFSGPWGVAYAVDARSGRHLWTYDPDADGEAARNACCDAVNRGVAVAGDRLFTAGADGQLAAVDRKSGKQLWKVDTIVQHRWNYSSSGAPQVAGDLVVIGNSGADMGARGYVSAYDQANGALRWRFWVVPGDPSLGPDENPDVTAARRTWPADTRWELGMGGNAWDAIAFDPETRTVFVGTGNGGPHPVWLRSKSGTASDQLYLSSIVALDAATGRVKWHYQTTPADSWDYAATSPLVMAEIAVKGRLRKVIMQAPKNGFFYVLDRETGELLQAKPYTAVNWASHVDLGTGRPVLTNAADFRAQPKVIWPSMAGGHAWTPMAFSPRTGLVYLAVYDAPASYTLGSAQFRPGNADHGSANAFAPFASPGLQAQYANGPAQRFEGRLKAIDPATGEVRWQSAPLPFLNGGTMVLGDLVLQGTADGVLTAYDAASGAARARIPIGTAMMAAPMSYTLDGTRYVAVLAGFGGPQGGFFAPGSAPSKYENFERLVVLKPGGGKIPLPPMLAAEDQQPVPPAIAANSAQMARGQALFQANCNRCHLMGGSRGIYPHLWNMPSETIAAFSSIVGDGALRYAGMGKFSDVLSPADIAAIKAFIVNDTIAKRRGGPEAGAHFREATH
jgi:quinohemoprotein ethanol dehydrogenase